ncbi:LysR family transcriptional regulator [Rhodobacteraceae bacterium B1Z28]|uniref:LysR family transcriptional regulator n=1 Tax=Ruegeria haliotis TaxID=2747601 RepID=A0ABX2PS30_9RHOB|nr:LysR family transcriptional regulator [Ruegeria haliotis]NVO56970.1 LysR family transcriptional regulator [Ruegeria haliotis]
MGRKTKIGRVSDADIHLMRVFQKVVECGGIAAAQIELGVGSSTISKQLSALETRFGFKLCNRGRSGFRLTQQGERALVFIQQFLAASSELTANIAGLNEELVGEVSIGIVDNSYSDPANPLVAAMQEFHNIAPLVNINLATGSSSDIELGVLEGYYHFGLFPKYQQRHELTSYEIYSERIGLFAGQKHPVAELLRDGQDLKPKDVRKFRIVNFGSREPEALIRKKARFELGGTVNSAEGVAALVRSGIYLGFFPQHVAAGAGDFVEILPDTFSYEMPMALVHRRNRQRTPVFQEFLRILESSAKN